jgi:hypothetical protein
VDPNNKFAEVLFEALEWNVLSREWNIPMSDLTMLHRIASLCLRFSRPICLTKLAGIKDGSTFAGHDEQERFASASCSEARRVLILLIYT